MIIRKPHYYDRFQCLAGSCPDSCCQEWDVQVDPEAARRYQCLPGELGEALRAHLTEEDGEHYLQITDRRCPMWRQDGLCRIQAELGHEGLCQVCREFPRLRHDYGDFLELGLELSCPEAARLIFTSPALPMTELQAEGGAEPEYDTEAMAVLLRTRQEALAILDAHPLSEALPLLLLYGYRAQEELDGGEAQPWDETAELSLAWRLAEDGDWEPLCEFYRSLELLTPRWAARLEKGHPHFPAPLSNMVRCGIERYWLQAVSDYDLVCRVKMILAGTLLVGYLGGDLIETAQLYSKEIDNSAENVEAILDGAYTHPALTDRYLLGLMRKMGSGEKTAISPLQNGKSLI